MTEKHLKLLTGSIIFLALGIFLGTIFWKILSSGHVSLSLGGNVFFSLTLGLSFSLGIFFLGKAIMAPME